MLLQGCSIYASDMKHKLPHPKKARISAGLKWREFAKKAGVSQGTISKCEKSGEYPHSRRCRRDYLAALGLSEE